MLDHVASRWGVLILTALDGPPLRFHVLRDRISGISEKMPSQNLRLLTRDGLIARTVEPTLPPRVSYELTPIGRGIAAHTRKLIDCIGRYAEDIAEAQRRYDLEADRR
ncbi:helix-turn-helix domain-containing protein [Streptomyces sp. NPDC006668]|uniref:winged helix-turn-helix transcriptional regulator n=1 Tax=Streptomyces sp. NPDC006668 TaxID=3156903 RepID=UPI0033D1A38A